MPAPRIEPVLPAAARVPRRRRDRRPQRPLRPRLPRAPPSSATAGPRLANRPVDTVRPRPAPGPRRGAQLQARHPRRRASGSTTSPSTGRSTTRWPPATCCTCCSSGPAASASPASTTCSRCPRMAGHAAGRQAPPHRRGSPARPASTCSATRRGEVLYVGKATNLRTPGALVLLQRRAPQDRPAAPRDRSASTTCVCPDPLEAAVLEVRLIHELQPRYNRQAHDVASVRLPQAHPQRAVPPAVGRAGRPRRRRPLPRPAARRPRVAQRVAEAIETAVPLRRCTAAGSGRTPDAAPVHRRPSSAWRRARAPAASTPAEYREVVERAVRGLTVEPELLLLAPLADRMAALARAERFEEAADVRDRAEALAGALRRQRRFDALRRAGRAPHRGARARAAPSWPPAASLRAWAPGAGPGRRRSRRRAACSATPARCRRSPATSPTSSPASPPGSTAAPTPSPSSTATASWPRPPRGAVVRAPRRHRRPRGGRRGGPAGARRRSRRPSAAAATRGPDERPGR